VVDRSHVKCAISSRECGAQFGNVSSVSLCRLSWEVLVLSAYIGSRHNLSFF
jgi:hypothetical protein